MPSFSCDADSPTFYVDCGRILLGTINARATTCAARCASLPGYAAFSVHHESACFCLKVLPTLTDTSTTADTCSDPNIIFSLVGKAPLCEGGFYYDPQNMQGQGPTE